MKNEQIKLESSFLYGAREDEALNIYNLAKFEPETLILNKLFENEELKYNDKLKVQTMVHNERLNESGVFFVEFLENLNARKNKSLLISEENYCYARDMVYRIFQRRLLDKNEFGILFRMVYQFQYLRFAINGSVRRAVDDLRTDEIFQNDEFWIQSLYSIFSAYKNRKVSSNALVKEMLIKNFSSLKELRQSQRSVLDLMKKVMSLSLGFQIEQVLDEIDARPRSSHTLVFYKESDIEVKKQLQIFN